MKKSHQKGESHLKNYTHTKKYKKDIEKGEKIHF